MTRFLNNPIEQPEPTQSVARSSTLGLESSKSTSSGLPAACSAPAATTRLDISKGTTPSAKENHARSAQFHNRSEKDPDVDARMVAESNKRRCTRPELLASEPSPIQQQLMYDVVCVTCRGMIDDTSLHTRFTDGALSINAPERTVNNLQLPEQHPCHLCVVIAERSASRWWWQVEWWDLENRAPDYSSADDEDKKAWNLFNIPVMYGEPRGITIQQVSNEERHNLLARRTSPSNTLGERTFTQIQQWVSDCLNTHSVCRERSLFRQSLPTRLLVIENGIEGTSNIRVQTTNELPKNSKYLSLSHCWGAAPSLLLTNSRIEQFASSIPMESLSKTFLDAIDITSRLGYQYLWIDSLCIIQDSREDWAHESSMMCDVYKNAELNLAATASTDGAGGLYHNQLTFSKTPCLINIQDEDNISTSYVCLPQESMRVWEENVEQAPLGQRSWVVQERVLSPRVIHFASGQVFWECYELTTGEYIRPNPSVEQPFPTKEEVFKRNIPPLWEKLQRKEFKFSYLWAHHVEKYTQSKLTFQSDRTVAIAGLARHYAQQLNFPPDYYLAGLWRPHLLLQLLWTSEGRGSKRIHNGVPSWSWASVEAPINPSVYLPARGSERYIQVIDASASYEGNDYARVCGGFVRLKGYLSRMPPNSYSEHRVYIPKTERRNGGYPDYILDDDCYCYDIMVREGAVCLFFDTPNAASLSPAFYGLLLSPTHFKRGQYKRLGVFKFYQEDEEYSEFERELEDLDEDCMKQLTLMGNTLSK